MSLTSAHAHKSDKSRQSNVFVAGIAGASVIIPSLEGVDLQALH